MFIQYRSSTMAYKVFLSHSMTADDQPVVQSISELLATQDIDCYIAERDAQPGESLATKIEQAIRDCDALYALLTKGGTQSEFVQQEIGFARGIGKPVTPIVEKGLTLKGFHAATEWIEFDRANPQSALLKLAPHVVRQAAAKDKQNIVGILILCAFLAFLIFRGGS
jgi:hypothetical protein